MSPKKSNTGKQLENPTEVGEQLRNKDRELKREKQLKTNGVKSAEKPLPAQGSKGSTVTTVSQTRPAIQRDLNATGEVVVKRWIKKMNNTGVAEQVKPVVNTSKSTAEQVSTERVNNGDSDQIMNSQMRRLEQRRNIRENNNMANNDINILKIDEIPPKTEVEDHETTKSDPQLSKPTFAEIAAKVPVTTPIVLPGFTEKKPKRSERRAALQLAYEAKIHPINGNKPSAVSQQPAIPQPSTSKKLFDFSDMNDEDDADWYDTDGNRLSWALMDEIERKDELKQQMDDGARDRAEAEERKVRRLPEFAYNKPPVTIFKVHPGSPYAEFANIVNKHAFIFALCHPTIRHETDAQQKVFSNYGLTVVGNTLMYALFGDIRNSKNKARRPQRRFTGFTGPDEYIFCQKINYCGNSVGYKLAKRAEIEKHLLGVRTDKEWSPEQIPGMLELQQQGGRLAVESVEAGANDGEGRQAHDVREDIIKNNTHEAVILDAFYSRAEALSRFQADVVSIARKEMQKLLHGVRVPADMFDMRPDLSTIRNAVPQIYNDKHPRWEVVFNMVTFIDTITQDYTADAFCNLINQLQTKTPMWMRILFPNIDPVAYVQDPIRAWLATQFDSCRAYRAIHDQRPISGDTTPSVTARADFVVRGFMKRHAATICSYDFFPGADGAEKFLGDGDLTDELILKNFA